MHPLTMRSVRSRKFRPGQSYQGAVDALTKAVAKRERKATIAAANHTKAEAGSYKEPWRPHPVPKREPSHVFDNDNRLVRNPRYVM